MEKKKLKLKGELKVPIIIAVVTVVLMIVSLAVLRSYVQRSIHKEREVYLTSQTQTLSDLINSTFERYSEYADVCEKVVIADLKDGMDAKDFMEKTSSYMGIAECNCMLVDSNSIWYGDTDWGKITKPEEFSSKSDKKTTYITQGSDADVESIVYRIRLDEPITVDVSSYNIGTNNNNNNKVATIEYVIVAYYLNNLHATISTSLPYDCNRFIIDEDGLMLYKNFQLGVLIKGTNILNKIDRVDFLYDDTGETQSDLIAKKKIAVGEFVIPKDETAGNLDGNYFICSAPLTYNDWSVIFIIPSDELSAGGYVTNLFFVMAAVAVVFAVAIATSFIYLYKAIKGRQIIAEEKETSELLRQASFAKSAFLSNMSHDIRTPINGIMGMTTIAKQQDNPEKTVECLNKIEGASNHLLSLVNDVLDMSSIESGKVVITNKPLDIRVLCDNCASIIKGQIGERDLKLVSEIQDIGTPYILADELHLRQVIINILSNSVKYTPDGGTIWLRMKTKSKVDNKVVIEFQVEDTGIGMKPEFIGKIFDSFSQEEGGSRTKYKGTGLGMAITKKFVDLMGGEILVESIYNLGSTFTVTIPFEITGKIEEEVDEATNANIEGCKVLLVEDNDLNLEIATQLIGDEGAIITPARDGLEAIKAFKDNPIGTFDVILMDIMMPEVDGLEATRIIRSFARDDAKDIPIIAMTANAFEEDIKATKEAGMNAHLSKPINIGEVIKTISAFYNKEEEGNENEENN